MDQDPEHVADAETVLLSSVLDTPKAWQRRQEKNYKRLRVLITELDGEAVTGTGIVRESLRHKDGPILGQTGVARDNERLTQTEA